jgi:ubiquinone/menaquinone biosynthesis C-methylase UbiE
MKKDETSWGKVAGWYDEHLTTSDDSYHQKVILPNLLRLTDIKKDERVLDLACGTGFFSKAFADAGAQVVGVDISKELIAIAKKNNSSINFVVSGADNLSFAQDLSIDKIVCVLAIQNIAEVKKMLEECARILTSHGKMYIVMNHPAYRIPKGSSWDWDEKTQQQYRRVDYYLSEKKIAIAMHPGKKDSEETISFHRPLQYYTKLFHNAGFVMSRLEEWISHKESEKGPRQNEENRIRKEIPLFMCIELQVNKEVV